jgi:lysophospholipase L1-like esterase
MITLRTALHFSALACLVGFGCGEGSDDELGPANGGDGGADSGGATHGGGPNLAGAGGAGGGGTVEPDGGSPVCSWDEGAAGAGVTPPLRQPWDWVGVIGTGQSLAVGEAGLPARSTTQPYGNLQLSTDPLEWPIDPEDEALTLEPLIEPIGRPATGYPSSWPENISGETIHSSMANQITALAMAAEDRDYVGVHGQFGENGQCIARLRKDATEDGVNGRAYAASLVATQAVTRLAASAGKTYGVAALTVVHGECDAGNGAYEDELVQLREDYDADVKAITGQTEDLLMLLSQQNSTNDRAASTRAQWQVGLDHPDQFVCVGPTYQYRTATDGTHLRVGGYQKLGEKFGQVYFERVVLGRDWRPLHAVGVERSGRTIRVRFHVPVPPLVWDDVLQSPHPTRSAWAGGKGFEVRSGSTDVVIDSVAIECDSVVITVADELPGSGVRVSYAMYAEPEDRSVPEPGTPRWGLLRDSDPFVGSSTGEEQPNFALAFELEVP